MKTKSILITAVLVSSFASMSLFAQPEGGNSGPGTGGTTGNSGTAGSGAEQGQTGINGGKNTAGSSVTAGAATNASTGEFHAPTTDPGSSQH